MPAWIGTLTAGQRLQIAARLAAISAFANKASFRTTGIASDTPEEIHIDDCIGGSEGSQESAIPVDRAGLRETLTTGLFSGRPGGTLGWSHATFADFLAATWIVSNDLSTEQTRSLLVAGLGGIYPQVSSVAAWLVAQAPEQFSWIVDLDPQALLGQVDLPGHDLRERLVEGLLRAAEQGQLVWNWGMNFSSLKHPSLAEQVRPRLRDPSRDVRRLVLDLARDCSLAEFRKTYGGTTPTMSCSV